MDDVAGPVNKVKKNRLFMLLPTSNSTFTKIDHRRVTTAGWMIRLLIIATALMLFAAEAFPQDSVSVAPRCDSFSNQNLIFRLCYRKSSLRNCLVCHATGPEHYCLHRC
jgi:hypothetical protein